MWYKVAEQMAAPWRMAEAVHQGMENQEVVRLVASVASSEGDHSRNGTTNLVPQANHLPELRMPIDKDTAPLPTFREMFSDVLSTHSAPE